MNHHSSPQDSPKVHTTLIVSSLLAFLGVGATIWFSGWLRPKAAGQKTAQTGVLNGSLNNANSPSAVSKAQEQAQIALAAQEESEKKILTDSKITDADLARLLLKYAQRQDPIALDVAQAKTKDQNPVIRAVAANALGFYEGQQAVGILTRLLEESDARVRASALAGLSHRPNPAREKAISDYLDRPNLSIQEQIDANSGLLRIAEQSQNRDRAFKKLFELAQSPSSGAAANQAKVGLMLGAPNDPRTLDLLRENLKKDLKEISHPTTAAKQSSPSNAQGIPFTAMEIRHLASVKDSWLMENVAAFMKSKDMGTRIAVVQSLHIACPENRFTILKSLIRNEEDPAIVHTAAQEINFMPGIDSVKVLKDVLESKTLRPEYENMVQAMLHSIQNARGKDPCLAATTSH